MRSFTSIAMLAAAAAGTVRADNIECVDGLYMLVARGTGEDAGPGETGKVANRIKDQIDNSTVKGLDYPASFNGEVGDNNYFDSVEKGYEAMKVAIQQYYDACPDHKMAIFGYSQVSFRMGGERRIRVAEDEGRKLTCLCRVPKSPRMLSAVEAVAGSTMTSPPSTLISLRRAVSPHRIQPGSRSDANFKFRCSRLYCSVR